ncbi:MAG TPA: methylenetetrahydrofolate reductase [Solirubrobacteraceae bacterium]|jgi:methylenetetrahydrofolate reductase (NADPH)|nr:methylenetetrahydrofolate reductase [Solirubrobacteraceae bacterium]
MSASTDEDPVRTAVEHLVRTADVELIPLRNLDDQLAAIPSGTVVTMTMSVKLGIDRTLEYTERAAQAGLRVIPHLAARQVADRAQLREIVGRLREMGIEDLYVVGGDAPEPAGAYVAAIELLEDLAGIDHGFETIGVGCYPEGHPAISDAALLDALVRKQPHASYMASQLCFDAGALVGWLRRMRAAGITLPLHLGVAAPMRIDRLAPLSARIGVGTSLRYLAKQRGLLGMLLRGRAYRPERLLDDLGEALTDPELAIEQVHLFSFNQVTATLDWQRRLLGA